MRNWNAVLAGMLCVWSLRPGAALAMAPGNGQEMPEFTGISAWLNTPQPLSPGNLRGKVVLVDFWTMGCGNCRNTLPNLRSWHERYAKEGLRIVGVHTPEFSWEGSLPKLRDAVANSRLEYPIAQDNTRDTWDAYGNRYWPAFYLFDKAGRLRYYHFGEFDDDSDRAMGRAIERLLEQNL